MLNSLREVPCGRGKYFVHASAVVDPGAKVGNGTRIWHFSHVMEGAEIGENCILSQNVFVAPGAVIGNGVKVQNNVSVYKGVVLEEEVFCGPSCVFTNVYNPRAFIERKDEFRPTLVKRGATLGANATLVCGVTIGRYALIGAGAVVKENVPDYGIVAGVPAQWKGWVCRCGVTLPKAKEKILTCPLCKAEYKLTRNILTSAEKS